MQSVVNVYKSLIIIVHYMCVVCYVGSQGHLPACSNGEEGCSERQREQRGEAA